MKFVVVFLVLSTLIAGSQGAAGDLDAACNTGDTCTDSNAYCDTTDTNNKLCKCNHGWVKKDAACVRGVGMPCDKSQCLANAVCTSGACACDTSKGLAAGTTGDATCSCPTNYAAKSDGTCGKVIDQACTAASDCIDNAVCTGSLCKCDTTKHFGVGTAGATSCTCDVAKATLDSTTGTCRLKHTQACTVDADCIGTDGMKCISSACGCDTTNNFAVGSAGDTTCTCATNFAIKADKTCGKKEGQNCAAVGECIDNTVCVTTCNCDATKNFEAATNLCQCAAATHVLKADNTCGKIIGQTCAASSECMDNAACVSTKCKCDATLNRDATTADGATTCACDANSVESNNICYRKVGQACDTASQCITTPGMTCATVSGSKICTCNTNSYYAAGSAGDTTCSCASANYHKQTDGSCALKIGQTCTTTGASCIIGARCDLATKTCLCDTSNNYAAGTAGDTTCSCATNAVAIAGTNLCGNKVGGTCTVKTATNVCTNLATCTEASSVFTCTCNSGTSPQTDKSCSGGAAIVSSIVLLTAGLLLTSRFT